MSAHIREEQRWNWKGEAATDSSKRERARTRYPLPSKCDECPSRATDRHHKDGDTGNNHPSNIAFLCRRCHMKADGRLDRFKALVPVPVQPPKPCINCKQLSKPLRKGRCSRCYDHLRAVGEEWFDGYQKKKPFTPKRYCSNCKLLAPPGTWSKGRCQACRIYFVKRGIERPEEYWGRDGRASVTPRDKANR